MRIVMVTDAWEPQVNGVVRTLNATRRDLEAMGHEVRMITPLDFHTLPCPTYPEIRLSIFPYRKVRRLLDEWVPDVLHIATEGPLGLAARRYALRRNYPFTTAYHTRFPEYVQARIRLPLSWTYRFLRWFHGPSQAVLAPTEVVKQDLNQVGLHNVVIWTRGVDLEIFKPEGEHLPLSIHHPRFLYVGRVAVEKNLEAFLQLDLPGSKWVAGAGPALDKLRQLYPQVHFTGVLDPLSLAALYRSADVFVFPSRTDTFGLVLLEAMACGVPVAAYPVTGPIDVIGDSGAGALHEDLQTACMQALSLSRERARQHAEGFAWRRASTQFLSHLRPIARIQAQGELRVQQS